MHNYMKILMRAFEQGFISPETIAHAMVAHDKWCKINRGKECNCDPEITIPIGDDVCLFLNKDGFVKKNAN